MINEHVRESCWPIRLGKRPGGRLKYRCEEGSGKFGFLCSLVIVNDLCKFENGGHRYIGRLFVEISDAMFTEQPLVRLFCVRRLASVSRAKVGNRSPLCASVECVRRLYPTAVLFSSPLFRGSIPPAEAFSYDVPTYATVHAHVPLNGVELLVSSRHKAYVSTPRSFELCGARAPLPRVHDPRYTG